MRLNSLTGSPFLRAAALAWVVALVAPSLGRSDAEQPLLRFVQLNDVHVENPPSGYPLANEKLQYLVNAFNAETYFPLPDFVVGVGDMVNNATTADFNTLLPILNGLDCDYYSGVGNHEDNQHEGDATYLAPYRAAFGAGHENYVFQRGGIQFLMVDDSGAPGSNSQAVGVARDQWVRNQLNATPGVRTIICTHIPLAPMREQSVLAASFGFSSYYANDATLLATIESHEDQVVAVLSGHLHLSGAVERNNVHHIVTSGTGSYPCDFAYYEVFSDHMSVQMYTLPEELRTPESDIHGLPRWTTDYTDATHPTHELYVSGNPWERSFDIPFTSGPVAAKSGFNNASGIADPVPLTPGELHGQGGAGLGWTRPWTKCKLTSPSSGTATVQTTTKSEGDQAIQATSGGTSATASAYGRTFTPQSDNLILVEFAVNIGNSTAGELYVYLKDFIDYSAGLTAGDAGVINIQSDTRAIRLYSGGVWQTTKWGAGAIALNTWHTIVTVHALGAFFWVN